MIDVLALPNVRVADAIRTGRPPSEYRYTLQGHKEYKEVMEHLIPKYPQWDFEFFNGNRHSSTSFPRPEGDERDAFSLTRARVYLGKELLGTLGIEYHGSERKVFVHNHRTSAQRSRNQGRMFTSDPKRAIQTVTKMFSRKSPTELMNEALDLAGQTIRGIRMNSHIATNGHKEKLKTYAAQMVLSNRHLLASMAAQGGMLYWSEVAESLAIHDKHADELALAQRVDDTAKATVIVLQNSYVVHWNNTMSICTNETLPHELRAPLGMLKLTEPKTLLHVGVRVDTDVYLIVPEGESNAA